MAKKAVKGTSKGASKGASKSAPKSASTNVEKGIRLSILNDKLRGTIDKHLQAIRDVLIKENIHAILMHDGQTLKPS